MIDNNKFQELLIEYKNELKGSRWDDEKFKWQAIKGFQDNWNIEANDFYTMLKKSLDKTFNLLASSHYFPKKMIIEFAQKEPETVRQMFIELFDESKDLYDRMVSFKTKSKELVSKYWKPNNNDFQTENTITTYLWLRYPDKYYIYKFEEAKSLSNEIKTSYVFKAGDYKNNIKNLMGLYDEICVELSKDEELKQIVQSKLKDDCYDDPKRKTLAIDFGYFVNQRQKAAKNEEKKVSLSVKEETEDYSSTEPHYWFLSANPKIWSMSSMPVGKEQSYTLYNDNASPIMMDIETRKKETERYYKSISLDEIRQRVKDPDWWYATRAMSAFVLVVAEAIGAKYIVPTDIAMVYGILERKEI